jgi:hypothetical protein
MQDPIVIQSHGLGVESQAILERWDAEPETRPFKDWSQLIVVTAQVGEEHLEDTVKDAEQRMLFLLRKNRVRFVELARRGHLQEEGIVVLQDTREPHQLHPQGVYKLSDELLFSGTVPQVAGEHRCALKFKAFVVETWLAHEFRGGSSRPVFHVFGYNAGEVSRIDKSEMHIREHNLERAIPLPTSDRRAPLMVFGFNSQEISRIDRSRKYDGPDRTGLYPLQDWGWDRAKCVDYIREQTGMTWKKSACSFCPYNSDASKCNAEAAERFHRNPAQTAHGLLVEYNSLCFNPRGQLYRDRAMLEVIQTHRIDDVMAEFNRKLDSLPWAYYKVRRIYTAKGKAARAVERLEDFSTRAEALEWWADLKGWMEGSGEKLVTARGIEYLYFQERREGAYPALEGFTVIAPAFMQTKVRGQMQTFDARWNEAVKQLQSAVPEPQDEASEAA